MTDRKSDDQMLINLKSFDRNILRWFPAILAIVCFGGILIASDTPGLYLDAVNPDYYAVQILNPSEYSTNWFLPNLGFPLLGQLYHGTITMMCNLITILITGTTSTLQLRLLNCFYGYTCCLILWRIFIKLKIEDWIAAGVTMILAISPNLASFYRTQFYIMLPGVSFFLLSIYYMIKWKENEKNTVLLVTGLFAGLSFYDYFSFGFCIPGFLITLLYISRKNRRCIRRTIFIFMVGLIIGCVPYIIGYLMLIMAKNAHISYRRRLFAAALLIIIWGVLIRYTYKLQKHDKLNRKQWILQILALSISGMLFIVFIIYAIRASSEYLISLNVGGTEADIYRRIELLIHYTDNILNHSSLEYLVIGENSRSFLFVIPLISIVLSFVILLYSVIYRRFSHISRSIALILTGTALYYVLSITFASRMQSQHFVIMLFISYLLLGLSLGEIFRITREASSAKVLSRLTDYGIVSVFCVLIFICALSQNTIRMKMIDDRKIQNKYYSQAVDKIAEMAIYNHERSVDEYYIFPEWGLMCGFDYLTCNTIPFNDHFDKEKIAMLSHGGTDIVVCYFNLDNKEQYKQELANILGAEDEIEETVIQCWGSDLYILTV